MKTGKRAAQTEYRFFAGGQEVDLERFLAAVADRGEATVTAEAETPRYRLTRKGRAAVEGRVA
jgi:hypothetical protein